MCLKILTDHNKLTGRAGLNVPSRSLTKITVAMKHASKISILNTAAALSLLLSASSCAKVSIDNPGQAERYIGFTSAVETKAPVESSYKMDEFAVWAAHYNPDGSLSSPLPMDGIEVYRDNRGAWVYDDLKLWENGDWHFEAFYPLPSDLQAIKPVQGKDALEVIFSAPKGEGAVLEGLTVNYYYGPTASHDLMTAEHTRPYTATDPNASAPVGFTFNHLLSRVTISVKTSSSNVSLTALTFSGMSVLGEYNGVGNSGKWRLLTDYPVFSDFPAGEFHADLTDWQNPLPSDGPPVDVLRDLLLIPQTPGDETNGHDPINIEVSYTLNGQSETKTVNLPSTPAWEPGRHYRYTLAVGTADVTLNIGVEDWDEKYYSVRW